MILLVVMLIIALVPTAGYDLSSRSAGRFTPYDQTIC